MKYPAPDNFEVIYPESNASLKWDVIGFNQGEYTVIEGNFINKRIANSFIDMYIDSYVREQFFPDGPSDC